MKNYLLLFLTCGLIIAQKSYALTENVADLGDYYLQLQENEAKKVSKDDVDSYMRQRWPEIVAKQIPLPYPDCFGAYNRLTAGDKSCDELANAEEQILCSIYSYCLSETGQADITYDSACENEPVGRIMNKLEEEKLCLIQKNADLKAYASDEMENILAGDLYLPVFEESTENQELQRSMGIQIRDDLLKLREKVVDHLDFRGDLLAKKDTWALKNGIVGDAPFDTMISNKKLAEVWLGERMTEVEAEFLEDTQAVWREKVEYAESDNEKADWWKEIKPKEPISDAEGIEKDENGIADAIKRLAITARSMKSKSHPASCFPKSQFESPIMNGIVNDVPEIDGEGLESKPNNEPWGGSYPMMQNVDLLAGSRALVGWQMQKQNCVERAKARFAEENKQNWWQKLTAQLIPRDKLLEQINACEKGDEDYEMVLRMTNMVQSLALTGLDLPQKEQMAQIKETQAQMESLQQSLRMLKAVMDDIKSTPIYE